MEQKLVSYEVYICRKDSITRRRSAVSNPKDGWKSHAGSSPVRSTEKDWPTFSRPGYDVKSTCGFRVTRKKTPSGWKARKIISRKEAIGYEEMGY
jgi:hypothetical protein